MLSHSIKFQCYIPKSLGKPLLSYFQGDSRFNRNVLSNYDEFRRKLEDKDRHGYAWLREPGGSFTDYFFATDNIDLHKGDHSEHSMRLGFHAVIDPKKVGKYSFMDKIFSHPNHLDGTKGNQYHQHSGESHRVRAYIKRIPFYTDMPRSSNKDIYIGVCNEEISIARSKEIPLKTSIENKLGNTYIHTPGNKPQNDTTVIKVSASAGYPFTEPLSPNIDFELEIMLVKSLGGKGIDIRVSGWHNDFPAYELIIGRRVAYTYNPTAFGYTGPGFISLSKSRTFRASEWIQLEDWQTEQLNQKNMSAW